MMIRSLIVITLLFAGIWILAGIGWALIAAAALTFAMWPRAADTDTAVAAAARRVVTLARLATRRLSAVPRRSAAIGGMASGIVLAPAGFGLSLGTGAALIAGAVLLIGVSIVTGWNA